MTRLTVDEAKSRLGELVRDAARGEDVVIEGDGASVRLVPQGTRPRATFGSARGLVHVRDDFDAPLLDFDEYAP